MSWGSHWPKVERAIMASQTTHEAAAKVSVIRGTPTTWGAVAAAWKRRRKREGLCTSAYELLGMRVGSRYGQISSAVEELERRCESYHAALVRIWEAADERVDGKILNILSEVLGGE